MKVLRILPAFVLFAGLSLSSCKPSDADVKAKVSTAVNAAPDAAAVTVGVADGVATLTGEVPNDAAKVAAETAAAAVKGVKSVVNNITVTPPTAPVTVAQDDPLTTGVRDAVKDFAGVTFTVNNGEVTVTGAAAKDKLEIKKRLDALQPKKVTFN